MDKQFIKLKNGKFKRVNLLKIYIEAIVESSITIEQDYIKFCKEHNIKKIQPMPEKQKDFLIAYKTKLAISLKYDFDPDSIVEALGKLHRTL